MPSEHAGPRSFGGLALVTLSTLMLQILITRIFSVTLWYQGIVVCLALTRFPAQLPRLYAADLAGSALGCLALVARLRAVDGPTAVFVVGAACYVVAAAALAVALHRTEAPVG